MKPDEAPSITNPGYNSFKNITIHKGFFTIPASITVAQQRLTEVQVFELQEPASFNQLYVYGTDYNDYFRFLDSAYHDHWYPIESTFDFLVFDNPVTELLFYRVRWELSGNIVTLYCTVEGSGLHTVNYTPNMKPKFAFVEYTLAEQFS